MSECRDIEPLLVDRALGELVGLKMGLVDAHLARCQRCREAADRLESALSAARSWQPSVDEAELDRMAAQLGPYLDAAQRPRWPAALGLGLAAALAALGVFGLWSRTPAPSPAPTIARVPEPAATPAAEARTSLGPAPAPAPAPVRRRSLGRGLKVVASADWDGQTKAINAKVMELEMSTGFVVLDLQTPGQRLYVRAPDVTVELARARVFVEIVPGSPTKIGVLAGQAVLSQGESPPVEIGAGEAMAVGGSDGPEPLGAGPTAGHRADAFLTAPEPEPVPVPTPKATPPKVPPIAAPPGPAVVSAPRPGVLEDLVEADALIRRGESGPALLLYDRVLASGLPAPQSLMVRFERARLLVKLGRSDEARPELEALARVDGEIGRQAAMLRCDLLKGCDARRCLRALAGQIPPAELEQKATRHACASE